MEGNNTKAEIKNRKQKHNGRTQQIELLKKK